MEPTYCKGFYFRWIFFAEMAKTKTRQKNQFFKYKKLLKHLFNATYESNCKRLDLIA